MIQSRRDLETYLNMDAYAMGIRRRDIRNILWRDVWKYIWVLRYYEYHLNCEKTKFLRRVLGFVHYKQGVKLGFDIPPNTCGGGLRINHFGNIIINPDARIGQYCDIHQGVNIGTDFEGGVPTLGDNVWIGPGAKLYGDITIGNCCAIGANAVVNKSFLNPGVTIAGVPAKIVSDKGNPYIKG